MNVDEADKVVHCVENEWHYLTMVKYGYESKSLTATGLSRAYRYVHPVTKREVMAVTNIHCDYWNDTTGKESGFWSSLEEHLKKIEQSY